MKRETDFLYLKLANTLRVQIYSGFIQPRQFLLSENEMCEKYNLSRTSVRKALQELLDEDLIVKIHGKGTMVSSSAGAPSSHVNTLIIAAPPESGFIKKGLTVIIREFRKRFPGVQIKMLPIPHDPLNYLQSLIEMGANPDMIFANDADSQLSDLDYLSPLDDLLDSYEGTTKQIIDIFKRNDQLYTAPLTYSPIFLVYNRNLFEYYKVEVPGPDWTLDRFIKIAQALTQDIDNDGMTEQYGFAVNSDINRWPVLLMKQWINFCSDRHNPLYTHELVLALRNVQQLIYRDKVCPIFAVSNQVLTKELFDENRIAMVLTSTYIMESAPTNYGIAPLPAELGDMSLLVVNGLQLLRDSKNKELAKQFLRFSLEPEIQRIIAAEAGLLSLFPDINTQQLGEGRMEALGITVERLERHKFRHQVIPNLELQHELEDTMKRFWAGMEKPETLVERLKSMDLFTPPSTR